MSTLIILHGPPAVGKSTLSLLLRKRLPSYAYVDRPMIKRGLKPAGRDIALRLSKQASYLLIKELITLGKDIITEEINPESLKRHLDEQALANCKLFSFRLTCPFDIAVERDEQREAKTVGPERMRELHDEHVQPFDYEIVIDTSKKTPEACIEEILAHMNK